MNISKNGQRCLRNSSGFENYVLLPVCNNLANIFHQITVHWKTKEDVENISTGLNSSGQKVHSVWGVNESVDIRMETEAKANSRRCFFGENCHPVRLYSRRNDFLSKAAVFLNFIIMSGSLEIAPWTLNLKEAG